MPRAIDFDRGVTARKAVKFDPKNPSKFEPAYGGFEVYMYKDTPGVYYDVHGRPVSEQVAKLAGFPIEELRKRREMQHAMTAAKEEIERQYAAIMDGTVKPRVLRERGDYQVIELPANRAKVMGKDGLEVTPLPISINEALLVLDALVSEEPTELTGEGDGGTVDEVKSKKGKE